MPEHKPTEQRRLQIGEPAGFAIKAAVKWNETGIEVAAGERYHFKAAGTWFDASIPSGPSGYKCERWFFRATAKYRRMPTADWFTLIGTVGKVTSTAFPVGGETSVTINSAGSLFFFANDLPFLYCNNHGDVHLEITREA